MLARIGKGGALRVFRTPKDEVLDHYHTLATFARKLQLRPDVVTNYFAGRMSYVNRYNRRTIRTELVRLGIVTPRKSKMKIKSGKRVCCR